MKDIVCTLALINREMAHLAAREKIANSQRNKYKSLRDAYVKTKFKQYQQIRKNIRTRHK